MLCTCSFCVTCGNTPHDTKRPGRANITIPDRRCLLCSQFIHALDEFVLFTPMNVIIVQVRSVIFKYIVAQVDNIKIWFYHSWEITCHFGIRGAIMQCSALKIPCKRFKIASFQIWCHYRCWHPVLCTAETWHPGNTFCPSHDLGQTLPCDNQSFSAWMCLKWEIEEVHCSKEPNAVFHIHVLNSLYHRREQWPERRWLALLSLALMS